MAAKFRDVTFPPLEGLTVSAPDGALIGIIGEEGSGGRDLLRLAAGLASPMEGIVEAPASRRLLDSASELDLSPAGLLLLDHALSRRDAVARARAAMELVHLRRGGTTILLVSHEMDLLASLADEIWWLDTGKLAAKGDPAEVLGKYREHLAGQVRSWGAGRCSPLSPPLRRGDGRAELVSIETLDERGAPTMAWRSGEMVGVRVTVTYREAVDDPVIGIMIRTRIGFEVYGTNTELEKLKLGPCAAGATLRLLFRFRCGLCPREYTLTAASHDPDGVLHEWIEDALAFLVVDSRFTAGVANLRAEVEVVRED
ncbi:MAG TPA: Wzt carbohydrate-binding domain-containing protein [Bryobacteraceae bacterium]|nr:Wzt carbohydrate-binding domain-containing protein [Bryobacteraceae bacterium]